MAWIRVVDEEDADGELKIAYGRVKTTRGTVANIFRVQSLDPRSLQAHLDLYLSLMSPLLDALCVARALPADGYRALLEQNGLDVTDVQRRKQETLDLLDRIKRALFVAKLLVGVGKLRLDAQDLDYARRLLSLAGKSVEEDKLGYVILIAAKGR